MNTGVRALIPTVLRTPHQSSSPAEVFLFPFFFSFYSSQPPVYRCHEDSKFHLLFSLRERKARNATAAVAAATTTTTTTRRDGFFHTARTRHLSRACDILIKCDDTPRSIQTERVHTLASCDPSSAFHPPTPVDISDITSRVFRPRIHTSISLPLFLLYFKSQSFPRASPLPRRGTILVESLLSFFF